MRLHHLQASWTPAAKIGRELSGSSATLVLIAIIVRNQRLDAAGDGPEPSESYEAAHDTVEPALGHRFATATLASEMTVDDAVAHIESRATSTTVALPRRTATQDASVTSRIRPGSAHYLVMRAPSGSRVERGYYSVPCSGTALAAC